MGYPLLVEADILSLFNMLFVFIASSNTHCTSSLRYIYLLKESSMRFRLFIYSFFKLLVPISSNVHQLGRSSNVQDYILHTPDTVSSRGFFLCFQNSDVTIYEKGCIQAGEEWMQRNLLVIASSAVGTAFAQVLFILELLFLFRITWNYLYRCT